MYLRNPKVEEAPLQTELMLFNPDSSQFYLLNATMAFIWKRWSQGSSVTSLVNELAAEFDGVDTAAAENDVRNGIDDLVKLGLLLDAAPQAR